VPPTPDEPEVEFIDQPPPLQGLIPQTGMLQWPIPVLTLLGMTLISCGMVIGRKGKDNEKN
jgi:hypothetical protein